MIFFFFSFQQLSLSKDLFHGVSDVVKSVVKPTNRITPKRTKPKVLETVNVVPSGWIQFKLDISFKDGICFTKDMVSYWQIIAEGWFSIFYNNEVMWWSSLQKIESIIWVQIHVDFCLLCTIFVRKGTKLHLVSYPITRHCNKNFIVKCMV